ncbi:hypothetical protein [Variovorax ginsengisoli]|uniref:Uncharacterized protein n=1 Tax=Variovorax ginsengisoli TaxID=363844 RepID=A0ABT9SDJ7_9BURK|nr:hypothetical protein [Variovorax ginsengisoli]MDP9902436.1 hypothetical protein [Variovorax ginsengisoli]
MKKYSRAAVFAIAVVKAIYPIEALAIDSSSAAAMSSAETEVQRKASTLRGILASQGLDDIVWWDEKYAVKFGKIRDAADTFYRWSAIQILDIAISNDGVTEPVPADVIAQIRGYFNQNGFTNRVYGRVQTYTGRSDALGSVGILKLAVDKFIASRIWPSDPLKILPILV